MPPLVIAIIPETIGKEMRDDLWETIAIGSFPYLTTSDDLDFRENEWPIVKVDQTVTDEDAAKELETLIACVNHLTSRVVFAPGSMQIPATSRPRSKNGEALWRAATRNQNLI